ncbi:MAG TPA: hypothetical protein VK472_07420 [Allosphingosinicella sp.]|nr:hypothetical protein [Allosphingosinicella sp.]
MSRSFYALLILAGTSGPAWSQTVGESVGTGSAKYFGHLAFKDDTYIEGLRARPCLVRKKTGRTECRTMYQWRRLARKIESRERGRN